MSARETVFFFCALVIFGALYIGVRRKVWRHCGLGAILVLCALSITTDLICAYMGYVLGRANYLVIHIYDVMEVLLLSWYFYTSVVKWRRSILIIALLVGTFFIGNSLFIQGLNVMPSYSYALNGLMYIVFALLGFHQLFVKEESGSLISSVHFWILCGIFFYFSGALFSHLLSSELLAIDNSTDFWYLHNFAILIRNLCWAIAFYLVGHSSGSQRTLA